MKGNPLGVFCLFSVWSVFVGGSVFVAARVDAWLASEALPAESPTLHDTLAGTAAKDAAEQLALENPSLKVDPAPGRPGQFRLTNAKGGAPVVVGLEEMHRLLASKDEVAKLFLPAPPAANAPAAVSGPADSGSSFSPPVPPLPGWLPVPPGAKLAAHYAAPDGQGSGTFLLSVPRPWADAARFYERRLQGSGYAVSPNEVVGGAMPGVIVTASLDGPEASRRTLQLTITQDGRGTQVSGTYGTGTNPGAGAVP